MSTHAQNIHTPWGFSQQATELAPGIVSYSTASHGGIHVTGDKAEAMKHQFPALWDESKYYADEGWFEEDEAWAAVILAFPALFSERCVSTCFRSLLRDGAELDGMNKRIVESGYLSTASGAIARKMHETYQANNVGRFEQVGGCWGHNGSFLYAREIGGERRRITLWWASDDRRDNDLYGKVFTLAEAEAAGAKITFDAAS
jgi:hypothetical protein